METLLTLLFMGILYIVPKMWGKYLTEMKKRSEVQGAVLPTVNYVSSEGEKGSTYVTSDPEVELPPVLTNVQSISHVEEEKTAWRGKLDQKTIVNGVIFAEILQPPRAYRPFVRR